MSTSNKAAVDRVMPLLERVAAKAKDKGGRAVR